MRTRAPLSIFLYLGLVIALMAANSGSPATASGPAAPLRATGAETEPNNTSGTANPLPAMDPCAIVSATISPGGDIDFFSFTANAGERIWAYADTGSPPPQVGNSTVASV